MYSYSRATSECALSIVIVLGRTVFLTLELLILISD